MIYVVVGDGETQQRNVDTFAGWKAIPLDILGEKLN